MCFNICGDARGYYAWLPALFIYHDLNFNFFDSVEMKEPTCGPQVGIPVQDYRYSFNSRYCDKYYPGASFLMLPFFIIAHCSTIFFTPYPPNGYSLLYYKIMALGGIFYYLCGMLFFLNILRQLQLNTSQKSLTILFITFGSNILFYSIDEPVYSHIYSFALVSAFIYYSLCLRDHFSSKYLFYISFLLGWIFITRPVNISVILFLPLLFRKDLKLISRSFVLKPINFLFICPALIMPLILCLLYKISTGHFFIYSYRNEGFNFLNPHVQEYLFSYDNGVLPYTPLLLLPFLFLFAWYKQEHKNMVLGLSAAILVAMYINCSWWCWWYGYSFGARTLLDFLPLFGILVGLSLKQSNLKRYYYLVPSYLLCCGLTILLYHQKSHSSFMNKYPITDYRAAIDSGLGIK